MSEWLHVEVIFADEGHMFKKSLRIEPGATVADAVRVSGIAAVFGLSEIDPTRVGVFGKVASSTTLLRDGDRVEIYRPLKIDPKEARRKRARK